MHVQDKMNILIPSTYQKQRISITECCITSGEFFAIVCILKENWGITAISDNRVWGIFEIVLIPKQMKR